MGLDAMPPLINLKLARDEWRFVHDMCQNETVKTNLILNPNGLKHVMRFMDDRLSCQADATVLQGTAEYGIRK